MCASVRDNKPLPYTVCICHIQSVLVTDSLCMSQIICVCDRHSLSVADSLCLSQKVCVCHRQYVSVTDSRCPSQTVCVFPRPSVFVTGRLCLLQIVLPVTERFCLSVSVFEKYFDDFNPTNPTSVDPCYRVQWAVNNVHGLGYSV